MCNHCYHKYGRNSNADACPHTDRLVYAKGKCQNCYLNDYNKEKRRLKKDKTTVNTTTSINGASCKRELLNGSNALEPQSKRFKSSSLN